MINRTDIGNDTEKFSDENALWGAYPELLEKLLIDHTTHTNIILATEGYANLGDGYGFYDEITPEMINGENRVIMPRMRKSRDEQSRRVRDNAEVFTPAWICNAQNNLIDEAWFGKPDVFNREILSDAGKHLWLPTEGKIEFPEDKSWKDYVRDTRLEITCGEAPYLVSRYDVVSGEMIPVERRIGLLDRKLRIVGENTETTGEWLDWARIALQNTYGYEWQGDSLILARIEILLSVIEHFRHKFNQDCTGRSLKGFAYIISWNIWQMDGLTYVIPGSCARMPLANANMFDDFFDDEPKYAECMACKKGKGEHIGIKARIRDWKVFHEIGHRDKSKTDIPFIQIVNRPK